MQSDLPRWTGRCAAWEPESGWWWTDWRRRWHGTCDTMSNTDEPRTQGFPTCRLPWMQPLSSGARSLMISPEVWGTLVLCSKGLLREDRLCSRGLNADGTLLDPFSLIITIRSPQMFERTHVETVHFNRVTAGFSTVKLLISLLKEKKSGLTFMKAENTRRNLNVKKIDLERFHADRLKVFGKLGKTRKERWYLIFGLLCLKNCKNLGIMMFKGRSKMSLSRISAESSQIFCRAPNAPWRQER